MVAQIAVVTDNRSLSLALTGLGYDVIDLRPTEFRDWLIDQTDPPALVVVGVEQPADALDVVSAATAPHPDAPTLVVSSTASGWDAFAIPGERGAVLPLPVTRTSLVSAAQRLIADAAPAPAVAVERLPEPVAEDAPEPGPARPVAASHSPAKPSRMQTRHMVVARSTDALRERLAQRADAPDAVRVPAPAHSAFDPITLRSDVGEAAAPPAQRVTTHHRAAASVAPLREMVEGVLAAVDELYDVRDAATAVVVESLAAGEADSGVVLLPDGDMWRVFGAAGVRPLEWRYVVEPDSWLVSTVISGDRGVIVEDSDIARQRLGGAPLAHHMQLLAAPIPQARGLVLIARESEAFTEQQLGAVAAIAVEAGALLADALRVRDLARALSDFRAYVD